jgi:hypothetical protein
VVTGYRTRPLPHLLCPLLAPLPSPAVAHGPSALRNVTDKAPLKGAARFTWAPCHTALLLPRCPPSPSPRPSLLLALQTQHTVFLGRVLVTLACIFPLTERSGVNILVRTEQRSPRRMLVGSPTSPCIHPLAPPRLPRYCRARSTRKPRRTSRAVMRTLLSSQRQANEGSTLRRHRRRLPLQLWAQLLLGRRGTASSHRQSLLPPPPPLLLHGMGPR